MKQAKTLQQIVYGSLLFTLAVVAIIVGVVKIDGNEPSGEPDDLKNINQEISEGKISAEDAIAKLGSETQEKLLAELEYEYQSTQIKPLRVEPNPVTEGRLSVSGVVERTNRVRTEKGLVELRSNEQLNQAARIKLKDMLDKQYFAHSDPEGGMTAEEVAGVAGYEFLMIGENLAWGGFADDEDLVDAWMDSPGHRDNMLNSGYREIGVAVTEGEYDGHKGWMAVQILGRSAEECKAPDAKLRKDIMQSKELLNEWEDKMNELHDKLKQMELRDSESQFRQLVEEYEKLVDQYDERFQQLMTRIEQYNKTVDSFNRCISQ